MGVGVEGHDVGLDVVFDELETLAGGGVVAVNVRFLAKFSPQQRVCVTADHILSNILDKFQLVLGEVILLASLVVD